MEPGFSSWMRKPTTPKEAVTKCKVQGICSMFMLAGKTGEDQRGSTPPKKYVSGTYCDLPCCVWGQKVGVLVARINPAEGKAPKFSEALRMLACEGNTEETAT